MTDNEIVKALEICTTGRCSSGECPYYGLDAVSDCMEQNGIDLIDLINRQKAEIERLSDLLKRNKRNCDRIRMITTETAKKIKAEAIKEFAERLKEEFGQSDIFCPRTIVSVTETGLDDLVKEMVGEG